jgi:hemerythrin-like domain-containing protein
MQALFSLQQDHRLLAELTDALEAFASALPGAETVPIADLEGFARAFREFADHLHYEKEEHVLMPFLARHGYDWNGELMAQVRETHTQNRYLIDVLHQAAQRKKGFSRDDHRRLASTAAALVRLQRRLLELQDVELFPVVSSSIAPSALEDLHNKLSDFDYNGGKRARELRQLVATLSSRYAA